MEKQKYFKKIIKCWRNENIKNNNQMMEKQKYLKK